MTENTRRQNNSRLTPVLCHDLKAPPMNDPKTDKCTHESCDKKGVGKAADTASHWLCQEHLDALTRDRDKFYSTGDQDAMKRMVGKAIRGMGGAKAATCSMVGHDWEQVTPTTERCMRCGKEMPV